MSCVQMSEGHFCIKIQPSSLHHISSDTNQLILWQPRALILCGEKVNSRLVGGLKVGGRFEGLCIAFDCASVCLLQSYCLGFLPLVILKEKL